MKKHPQVSATTMDGVKKDIPGHFSDIYNKLYNSHDDQAQIEVIENEVREKINFTHLQDVTKVTHEIVKKDASQQQI